MSKSGDLFKSRLNGLLEVHGSVADFMRKSGFSRTAVDNWLDGKAFPTVDSLDRIAEALGTTPAALLAEDPTPSEASLLALVRNFSHLKLNILRNLPALNENEARNILNTIELLIETRGLGAGQGNKSKNKL